MKKRMAMFLKRMLLLIPLIIMGGIICGMVRYSKSVLYSGIVTLLLSICMNINEYYGNPFPRDSVERKKLLKLHWWLCILVLVAGIIFVFSVISAIEKLKK